MDAVWCIPPSGNISSMPYAIMADADWGIPPSGTLDKFRGAFVTDVDWCIPSGGSFDISFNSHLRRIPFDESRLYHHSRSFDFQISHFNSIFTFVLSFQRYTQSMSLFHILIHVLISYPHSCNKNRAREQNEVVESSFLLFGLDPRLGDHHPSLVNNIHATLSG